MAIVKFKGANVNTVSELPKLGSIAPEFTLVGSGLQDIKLSDFKGKKVVLNIFPSLDTGTCAASVRNFNKLAAEKKNTVVICISKDLPFAHNRFCSTEGIQNVVTASDFRANNFDKDYGLLLIDGPLKGLLSRCVIVIDEEGKIIYSELVEEIVNEPNYNISVI